MTSVRTWIAVGALVLAGLLGVGSARADTVYVLNSGQAYISMLDSRDHTERGRVPVLREVHHLVLSPDRASLVIGDSGANELLFLDPATGAVQRRVEINDPYHLEYSPDGKYLVITSIRRDQVDIYDSASLQLVGRVRAPSMPSHLEFSPDSRRVFVTLQGSRSLMAIDLAERRALWTAEIGPQPAGIIWHRDRLVVGIMGSDHFAVINPDDGRVERTVFVGRGAHAIFASPDGRVLYATSRVDSRISVLEAGTLRLLASWVVNGGPDCIAFAPDGRLWATLRWTRQVAVIDPTNGSYETMPVGRSPHGIYVQPSPGTPVAAAMPVRAP